MRNTASYFLFNSLMFGVVVGIFFALAGGFEKLHPLTLILGILFGVLFIVTIFVYMKAMETGPLSYTALFYSFGLIIPVLLGILLWNEKANFLQIIGLILLLITFYIGSRSTGKSEKGFNIKWLMLCISAFIGNGGLMALSKYHQIRLPGQQVTEFLILSFSISSLLSLILFLWYYIKERQTVSHLKTFGFIIILILAAVTTAFGNQLALILASRVPAIIQFPSINGGVVMFSSILSWAIFKEKLDRNGVLGIVLGLAAIILLSIR